MTEISQELINSYHKTTYIVYSTEKFEKLELRINIYNPLLDDLIQKYKWKNWAFITAFNPFSRQLNENENLERHRQLIKEINGKNYLYYPGEGKPDQGEWQSELSLFIPDIPVQELNKLLEKYEQNAAVTGLPGGCPKLYFSDIN
jgi:hypothetical protein